MTFKLHLAACHLPDQVRCGGAAYFSLEFWVERMVQDYKGYIRGRGTGKPELLYVKDEVMSRACRRMRRERQGWRLQLIQEAVRDARARRRPRGPGILLPRVMGEPCPEFSGAPRPLTEAQRELLLPDYSGEGDLGGLGYILQETPELEEEAGWPTFPEVAPPDARRAAIAEAIGVGVAGNPPKREIVVHARKFTRAVLPCGDSACSAEYKGQIIKDDTWAMVRYLERDAEGDVTARWYVAHIRFLAQAVLARVDDAPASEGGVGRGQEERRGGVGAGPAREEAELISGDGRQSEVVDEMSDSGQADDMAQGLRVAKPLAVAVVDLFRVTPVAAPGVSEPAADGMSPPPFVFVSNLVPSLTRRGRPKRPFAGTYAVLVSQIDVQLLPGEADRRGRYFSIASKASGRVRRLYGKFPIARYDVEGLEGGPAPPDGDE